MKTLWFRGVAFLLWLTSASWIQAEPGTAPPDQLRDDLELVKRIREKILATQETDAGPQLKSYTLAIPKTGVEFTMKPIPAGEYLQGSPETEPGRKEDEGPQRQVRIAPFWMGKHEVTWDEYEPFMMPKFPRNKDGSPVHPRNIALADIVSGPTTPHAFMDFGRGTSGFPAICMTQHAALKYCQWLSAQTGHFYRLPTEAEWEYACRAGTTTAFSWGGDPAMVDDHAWYWDNSDDSYQKVGLKKPNPWGLHDMHGNVFEWTLDRYLSEAFARDAEEVLPFVKRGESQYPRVVRGGSWYDDVELLRSASRVSSSADWKLQDPQKPKSIWHLTEAHWLGFRLVRPVEIPSAEEMHAIWNQGQGKEEEVDSSN